MDGDEMYRIMVEEIMSKESAKKRVVVLGAMLSVNAKNENEARIQVEHWFYPSKGRITMIEEVDNESSY